MKIRLAKKILRYSKKDRLAEMPEFIHSNHKKTTMDKANIRYCKWYKNQIVMTVKELMIGDWVILPINNVYDKVISLNKSYLDTKLLDEVAYRDVKPIPLTLEILEKNGFKNPIYSILQINDHQWLEFYLHEHRLRLWSNIKDEWDNNSTENHILFQCNIFYVHELQHALKLCGINKEIEL